LAKTRHERDRSEKVNELLDVAEQLFKERGYVGTTTALLADAAGVAQNAVYWYFPSKDHLFVAVLERMLDALVADVAKDHGLTLESRVTRTVKRLQQTEDLRVALLERSRESDIAAAFATKMRATLYSLLVEAVRREVPEGNHPMIARGILAVADGTHGMPTEERLGLVAFAVRKFVEH
jgi:AcrR family transcriptional regulator